MTWWRHFWYEDKTSWIIIYSSRKFPPGGIIATGSLPPKLERAQINEDKNAQVDVGWYLTPISTDYRSGVLFTKYSTYYLPCLIGIP